MLYELDEPSVGLHPSNVQGLRATIAALAENGNSVVVVEPASPPSRSRTAGQRKRPPHPVPRARSPSQERLTMAEGQVRVGDPPEGDRVPVPERLRDEFQASPAAHRRPPGQRTAHHSHRRPARRRCPAVGAGPPPRRPGARVKAEPAARAREEGCVGAGRPQQCIEQGAGSQGCRLRQTRGARPRPAGWRESPRPRDCRPPRPMPGSQPGPGRLEEGIIKLIICGAPTGVRTADLHAGCP